MCPPARPTERVPQYCRERRKSRPPGVGYPRSVSLVPRRLDFVRFRVGDDDVDVAFTLALELADRAARAPDDAARSAATRIRGAGASRPVRLLPAELDALAEVIDAWSTEADTARRLRKALR